MSTTRQRPMTLVSRMAGEQNGGHAMRIAVCCKIVPDDQDIQVAADRTLDYSKARSVVSTYDLNALEAAAELAAHHEGSTVIAVSAGTSAADDSKTKKNILSRGVDELYLVADDALGNADARTTANVLVGLVQQAGCDLVLCGDGSADVFAKQVDVHVAECWGVPVVNGAVRIEASEGGLLVERMLEDEIETVEVSLPAVVSVVPDIALPRIPGMKDILAAGKKPVQVLPLGEVPAASIEVLEELAPPEADRKHEVHDAGEDGAVAAFTAALKAAL